MEFIADIPIKDETHELPPFNSPDASPLKRRRSDHSQDMGEKRQRLDHIAAMPNNNMHLGSSPSIADLAAQASEAVMAQYLAANQDYAVQAQAEAQTSTPAQSAQATTNDDMNVPTGSDFISDPYLYMRIFSLPILESLVRGSLEILLHYTS